MSYFFVEIAFNVVKFLLEKDKTDNRNDNDKIQISSTKDFEVDIGL